MKNIREANLRTLIIKAIGFLATPIVIAISFKLISGGDHFVWSETHNFIETSAALTCILSAYCLYLYFLNRKTVRHLLLASAFLLAGLFLIAHRFMPEGTDEFSLFYILSGLSAGITLAAGISGEATLEKKPAELKKIAYRSVLLTIAFLSILYFFSAHFDHLLPKVVWGDRFTEAARAMNFLFAGLFFASAALFLQRYKKTKEQEDFLFFFVLIMFFTDRIIASYARMWGSAWWIAHFLRLSITLVLAAYLLRQYARSMLNFVSEIEERKMAQRELTANGQQLKSANQQLTAAEQQLRAQNQQLRAGEEQVRNTTRQIEFILGATQ
ncbi:MAG: hypothetical protein KKF80_06890, partial [Candidatus Omnitrophica bacterium]|nr:hypothetical protein [Candidatus Omnitrophota bacterium]